MRRRSPTLRTVPSTRTSRPSRRPIRPIEMPTHWWRRTVLGEIAAGEVLGGIGGQRRMAPPLTKAEILWRYSANGNSENLGPQLPWTGQMTGNVARVFAPPERRHSVVQDGFTVSA